MDQSYMKERSVMKLLLTMSLPMMISMLVNSLYNIVDSFFVAKISEDAMTALSLVFPMQNLVNAVMVGFGIGINAMISFYMGANDRKMVDKAASQGMLLGTLHGVVLTVVCILFITPFLKIFTSSEQVVKLGSSYSVIVFSFSVILAWELVFEKTFQAVGRMAVSMVCMMSGCIANIILDPLLIFGMLGLPEMGIAGAAAATVAGQIVAALIVMKKGFRRSPERAVYPHHIGEIFRLGAPNILMQSAYTFYIFGLNLILAAFSDQAVTVLGLYYKWQSFFFIPLGAMQTCIVPVISFNYASRNIDRCKKTLWASVCFGMALMALGTLCFELIPTQMLRAFSSDEAVIDIGRVAFRIIGVSFLPLVTSLTFPVFFQAVGSSMKSSALTVIRTVVLFVPLGYAFSRIGLNWFWLTFPVTDTVTSVVGVVFYRQFLNSDYVKAPALGVAQIAAAPVLKPSAPGVIITIAREHGSSGKQIGKLVAEKLGIPFYYKEMIALAAHESGLDQEFISDVHKNSPDILRELYLSTRVVQDAIEAQEKIIRKIADNGSCVIVGRSADYVLKDYENVVRVFVHAPMEFRIGRVREVYGDTLKEAKRNIRRSDKARAAYYKHISGMRWGEAKNYELTVDSSVGTEKSAEIILAYISAHERKKSSPVR